MRSTAGGRGACLERVVVLADGEGADTRLEVSRERLEGVQQEGDAVACLPSSNLTEGDALLHWEEQIIAPNGTG